jgi:glucosyl-dolichyl phosphate glucuronosyltransferase
MNFTIAIATHNRADDLRLTLHGLTQLPADGGPDHEILVVGNRCTDHTREVIKEASAGKLGGRLRYVEESCPGLSAARNRAVAESESEIVAFLDDDVDVDRDWLRALADAYRSNDYAAIGGRAHLVYPGSKPRWISGSIEGLLSRVDYGDQRQVVEPDWLYGVNLSIRREWLERVGPFRTDLGRVGRRLTGGEETELLGRIVSAGGRLLYEPRAAVGHRVSPERLRRSWFLSRCYWGKHSAVRFDYPDRIRARSLAGAGSRLCRASMTAAGAFLRHGFGSPMFFDAAAVAAQRAGTFAGLVAKCRCRAI